ncbi:hypothetical protein Dsin_024351 [Dipteronia sinensis]|uniref:Uncharacterized protein n=1 Tax=Dipteronia sinensis TaxID=43782 RepID=A0AAD9ZUC7_9ROSI|nr:hypothetical protein Dsin_024351 [Dipteronia sinensis]
MPGINDIDYTVTIFNSDGNEPKFRKSVHLAIRAASGGFDNCAETTCFRETNECGAKAKLICGASCSTYGCSRSEGEKVEVEDFEQLVEKLEHALPLEIMGKALGKFGNDFEQLVKGLEHGNMLCLLK